MPVTNVHLGTILTIEELHREITELIDRQPELATAHVIAGNPSGKHGTDVVDLHITRHHRTVVLGTNGYITHFEDAIF